MNKNIYNKATFYKIFLLLFIILLCLIILSVFIGSTNISLINTIKVLLSNFKFLKIDTSDIPSYISVIINRVRLPRVLGACIVGASIASTGATYQSILKSDIVDPFILGISSGAAFGATIALIFRLDYLLRLFAFIGAIITSIVVYILAKRSKNKISLVLIGLNFNYFITALISLLMMLNDNALERVYFWTQGNLTSLSVNADIVLFAIAVPCIVILSLLGKWLNAINIDPNYASTIGIDVDKLIKIVIIIVSIITAFVVSYTGIIGFVGLMIPHICKSFFGYDNRYIIPYSALIGAMMLLLCDNIARLALSPTEIPVGVVTSLIGAPATLILILKARKKKIYE